MAIVKTITLKDSNNQDVLYDIGANATNIAYDNSTDVKTKIDQKVTAAGGSIAATVAGAVNSKNSSSNIATTDTSADIWGKVNALRNETVSHISARINTATGTHGLRYYNNELQYYDGSSWKTIETGGGKLDIIVGDVSGATVDVASASSVNIHWSDPEDVILGGTKVATWVGTALVRKVGSAPTSRTDGTEIAYVTTRNQYSMAPFVDRNLATGTVYYYRFFTVTQEKTSDPNYEGDAGTTVMANPSFSIPSWANSLNSQSLSEVLDAYYNDEISIDYIKQYWHVGDVAETEIWKINATGTYNGVTWTMDESHHSQKIDVVILGFEHDELETPINGHTKAMISVQVLNVLYSGEKPSSDTVIDSYSDSELTEAHTSGDVSSSGARDYHKIWSACQIRNWCNGGFYQALGYHGLTNKVKPVKKTNLAWASGGNDITTDYIWLVSSVEILGAEELTSERIENYSILVNNGTQYDYYKNLSNIYKYPKWNPSDPNPGPWHTRDIGGSVDGSHVAGISWRTTLISREGEYKFGLSPAWAM